MKTVQMLAVFVAGLLGAMIASVPVVQAQPTPRAALGSAFTYQGRLNDGAQPAEGSFDFQFLLYDAALGGAQQGPLVTRDDVVVRAGLFSVALDFGAVFTNTQLFLDIGVRPGQSSGSYTPLTPRQPLTAAPFSFYASTAQNATAAQSAASVPWAGITDKPPFQTPINTDCPDYSAISRIGPSGTTQCESWRRIDLPTGERLTFFASTAIPIDMSLPEDRGRARITLGQSTGQPLGMRFLTCAPGAGVCQTNLQLLDNGSTETRDLNVRGTLTKSAGTFLIDHPLDPQNKYLSHSFVESPDMKNLYDGVATIGSDGRATVTLPSYFDALNGELRYQLTAIGGAMPELHIAEEVQGNTFVIGGGTPGLRVAWQVTGSRHDPYARANPVVVEHEKPAGERGTYLHPELYSESE
jgi:hypothetical protein